MEEHIYSKLVGAQHIGKEANLAILQGNLKVMELIQLAETIKSQNLVLGPGKINPFNVKKTIDALLQLSSILSKSEGDTEIFNDFKTLKYHDAMLVSVFAKHLLDPSVLLDEKEEGISTTEQQRAPESIIRMSEILSKNGFISQLAHKITKEKYTLDV